MGAGITARAESAIMDLAGANCKVTCETNLFTRCSKYKLMTIIGYLTACLIFGGACICMLAAATPFLAKENTKDKQTIFYSMVGGALLAVAGLLTWGFVWLSTHKAIRATTWYPDYSFGISFYLAIVAVGMCIFSTLPQLAKVTRALEDKRKAKQLLVDSVDPAFFVDPALL